MKWRGLDIKDINIIKPSPLWGVPLNRGKTGRICTYLKKYDSPLSRGGTAIVAGRGFIEVCDL